MNIQFSGDYWVCLLAFCTIAVIMVGVQWGIRHNFLSAMTGRKTLHASAIGICAVVIDQISDRDMLAGIFMLFFIVLTVVARKKLLFREKEVSYGIAFFTLAFAIELWLDFPSEAIVYGAVVTAICDPLAGMVGSKYGKNRQAFLFEEKSWEGFLGFYMSCLAVSWYFTGWHAGVLLLGLIPAIAELYSWRGSDNFTVPFFGTVWFMVMKDQAWQPESFGWFLFLILAMIVVIRRRWLTTTAVPAAFMLAAVLLCAGSWHWLLTLGTFFVCGSISSRFVPVTGDAKGRNAKQVFANGGVAGICVLGFYIYPDVSWIIAFMSSVAVSMSDTLSSDLGILAGQRPVDILQRTYVEKGMSGGVTWYGTMAGLAGSLIIAATGSGLFNLSVWQFAFVALMGFSGMILDSVLGSLIQAKYTDSRGQLMEESGVGRSLVKGSAMITNNAVNLIANAGITITTFIFSIFLT